MAFTNSRTSRLVVWIAGFRRTIAWLLTATVALTALPGTGLAADLMTVEKQPSSKGIGIDAVKPLAKVELKNGAWLEFIDVGDGYVGIGERSSVSAPFITTTLVSEWNATPLEIYLEFAPNGPDVPALETDHKLRMAQAGGDIAEPSVLPLSGETFAFDDSELEEYPCDGFGFDWVADWENEFNGVTDYTATDFKHFFMGPYLFYPGAHVYNGTGTNRKTYLGACNGDPDGNKLLMEVHRWAVSKVIVNPYPNPPTVVWDWVKIHDVSIDGYYKYTFYSGHPTGRYRGRLQAEPSAVVAHMGFAAAWTKSFPVVGLSSD